MSDLVGTYPRTEGHAAVAATRTIAALLRADANEVDVHGVTRARVDLVAGAGLLGLSAPRELGGGDAPPEVVREVTEQLAGACGSTWFVLAQHRAVLESALATDNETLRSHWRSALATGDALGAVAFAHLRRPGAPTVTAQRVGGGWQIDGDLDWVTSWGLADALLLMAETADGQIVQAVLALPPGEAAMNPRPGMRSLGPVPLAAMGGTHTHAVELRNLIVPDVEIAAVVPTAAWRAADSARLVHAPPHAFGLARAAIDALEDLASSGVDDDRAGALAVLAAELAEEVRDLRTAAYGHADRLAERSHDDPAAHPDQRELDELVALRAQVHDVTLRSTAAYLTARAGGGMRLTCDAQRFVREAAFHLVQAQTSRTRAALLDRFP